MGLFILLIVGTFNYLGYDEGEVPQQADSGKGRNLAEQYDKPQLAAPKSQDAVLSTSEKQEEKQDQTHQLQASALQHEAWEFLLL